MKQLVTPPFAYDLTDGECSYRIVSYLETLASREQLHRHIFCLNEKKFPPNEQNCVWHGYHILKSDRKSQVLLIPEQNWVVKKSLWLYHPWVSRVKYGFVGSRAERSWHAARWLLEAGVAVPRPIAWIECFEKGFPTASFFVMEYVVATPATDWIQSHPERLWQKIESLLEALAQARLVHGDLKLPNILVDQERLCIIDLDSARRSLFFFLKKDKDRKRVHRSFECYYRGEKEMEEPS